MNINIKKVSGTERSICKTLKFGYPIDTNISYETEEFFPYTSWVFCYVTYFHLRKE